MTYFGYQTYVEAKKYESYTTKIAKIGDANGLAEERIDEFTEIISLGLVKNQTKTTLIQLKKKQFKAKEGTSKYLTYFIGIFIILSIFIFTCTIRIATIVLSIVTFISLIYGLITPILMVTIHKEIEYLGNVILSFESKGILGAIEKLYNNEEYVVAITILLFSVILPILKSITLSFTLLFHQFQWTHKLVHFFKQLGKWSMIDVFVVATLLVYLTSNGDNSLSHAEIQVGLYFFLLYVLLSMVTAILTQKVLHREKIDS
jgi:hypothetical protein